MVDTSDRQDFQLLSEVTQNLDAFNGKEPAISGVCRLFKTFISLCQPLVEKQTEEGSRESSSGALSHEQQTNQGVTVDTTMNGTSHALGINMPPILPIGQPMPLFTEGYMGMELADYDDATLDALSHIDSLGEDDMFAELCSTHPSLQWINGAWNA